MIGLNCCMLLLGAYIAYSKAIIPLPLLCLVISGIIPGYFWKGVESQPYLVHIIVLVSVDLLISAVYSWSFLSLCAPMHMLLAVVLCGKEGDVSVSKVDKYHNLQL